MPIYLPRDQYYTIFFIKRLQFYEIKDNRKCKLFVNEIKNSFTRLIFFGLYNIMFRITIVARI